jgi:uncharacterized protein
MNCPVDGTQLLLAERKNVEIDYCPQCRGVWLDRGELDKVVERAAELDREDDRSSDDRRPHEDDRGRAGTPKKRREPFLGDLFDFGG